MSPMVRAIRTVDHEERLSLVDHLEELRARLIISGAVLAVVFGVCVWQNHALLEIVNRPLTSQTKKQVEKGQGTVGQAVVAQKGLLKIAVDTQSALGVLVKPGSGISAGARAELTPLLATLKADAGKLPRKAEGDKPVTLGVGEPFTTTLTVTLYFALIIALPVILYELYGFIMPALSPSERRAAAPLLTAGQFNVLVQANQFYSFAATILLAMGVVFQIPVLILGATRLGLVTPRQLRKNRRYAVLACAAVAAFLPGDAITLVLETVPLYVLYEASILVASFVKPLGGEVRDEESGGARGAPPPTGEPAPTPDDP